MRRILQAIETHYLPPSNRPTYARIAVRAQAGRMTVPWDDALSDDENHCRAAQAFADKWGWEGELIGGGLANGGRVFVLRVAP